MKNQHLNGLSDLSQVFEAIDIFSSSDGITDLSGGESENKLASFSRARFLLIVL